MLGKSILLALMFTSSCISQVKPLTLERPLTTIRCITPYGKKGFCQSKSVCPKDANLQGQRVPRVCLRQPGTVCCPVAGISIPPLPKNETVTPPKVSFECGLRGIFDDVGSIFLRKRRAVEPIGSPVGIPLDVAFGEAIDPHLGVTYSPTVVGGSISFRNTWPWMALLGNREDNEIKWFCDGVLINEKFVLTAAHCVLSLNPIIVRLGEHNYAEPKTNEEDIDVAEIIFYPDFNLIDGYHDLALLRLDRAANLNQDHITPICLPWGELTNENFIDENVYLTGWGAERYGGKPSPVLQEVLIKVFDTKVCEQGYSTLRDFSRVWPRGMTNSLLTCAGDLLGGKDSCQGDSGGPLVYYNKHSRYTLVGIVSKGHGCGKAEFPGLYAPVAQKRYLEWIKKIAF